MVSEVNAKKENIKLSPKERLLACLIENKSPQSIKSISGSALIDYKNTFNLIEELQPEIVSKEKIGNTNLIRLNLISNTQIYNIETKRTEQFLTKNPKLKVIKKYAEELNYPFMIVLIFGSYAKKNNAPNSDIDLCIISDNKEKTQELHDKLNLLSLKLEVQEFTAKEFISMIERKNNNLGNEIIKSNILLYGIENYYNLISKWTSKE